MEAEVEVESTQTVIDRLLAGGDSFLAMIDEVNAREEQGRTMGSMALSSYRSDLFCRAMDKYEAAIALGG